MFEDKGVPSLETGVRHELRAVGLTTREGVAEMFGNTKDEKKQLL